MNNTLVSICCQTYNHENYISEAIESFLMQKTDFDFEILIRDDASTDGTTKICKEYANKYTQVIKLLTYTENQYQKGIKPFFDNVKRAKGKYIAFCEGDDYWSDPLKLQKQVDFLEKNIEIGLCYTKAKVFVQKKKKYAKKNIGFKIPSKGLVFKNTIPPLTILFRKNLFLKFIIETEKDHQKWKMGDYPLSLWFEKNSNIFFLNDITSVYRLSQNSMSQHYNGNKRLAFLKNSFDIANCYAKKTLNSKDYQEFLLFKYLQLYNTSIKLNTIHYREYSIKLSNIKHKNWKVKIYLFFIEFLGLRKIIFFKNKLIS